MGKASGDRHLLGNKKDRGKEQGFPGNQDAGEGSGANTDVKDAQAAGIGALGRTDENQIEKLIDSEPEKDDAVY